MTPNAERRTETRKRLIFFAANACADRGSSVIMVWEENYGRSNKTPKEQTRPKGGTGAGRRRQAEQSVQNAVHTLEPAVHRRVFGVHRHHDEPQERGDHLAALSVDRVHGGVFRRVRRDDLHGQEQRKTRFGGQGLQEQFQDHEAVSQIVQPAADDLGRVQRRLQRQVVVLDHIDRGVHPVRNHSDHHVDPQDRQAQAQRKAQGEKERSAQGAGERRQEHPDR